MKTRIIFVYLAVVTAISCAAAGPARAQSIFLEPNSPNSIHLEALRLGYPDLNQSNASFTYFLSGRIRVGEQLQLRAEVPFVYFKLDESQTRYDSSSGSESDFGNPYVGLDMGRPEGGFRGEFGLRWPVMDSGSEVAEVGILTDPVERMEAFTPDLLPLYVGTGYDYHSANGLGLRLRMVPVLWLWVGDSSNADPEVMVQYSAQAWYEDGKVGVGGGFSGRAILTGDDSGIAERTIHQFGFFANYTFGSVMPGFQVRFPLDSDLKDSLHLIPSYSLSVGVKL